MTRIISTEEIEEHLSMDKCLSILEVMFEEMGRDRAITDSREDILTPVETPPEESTDPVYHGLKSMGGTIANLEIGAIRINSDVINWPRKGGSRVRQKIPAADGRYTGLVLLFSTSTGEPLAIFPDGYVQSYRVGGTSALGAKYLAREDATTLGMLGAGQQARHHLEALNEIRDLEQVRVFSPTPESRSEYAEEMDEKVAPSVEAVDAPEKVFRGADIVQCTTNSMTPVFEPEWIEPGTHLGIIRVPEEMPDELLDPDRLFSDNAFDTLAQSWSPHVQIEELANHLSERLVPTKNTNSYIVGGKEPVPKFEELDQRDTDRSPEWWADVPGLGDVIVDESRCRSSEDGITIFYNRGLGVQFAALGKAVFDLGEEHDLGHEVPTEILTQEYKP